MLIEIDISKQDLEMLDSIDRLVGHLGAGEHSFSTFVDKVKETANFVNPLTLINPPVRRIKDARLRMTDRVIHTVMTVEDAEEFLKIGRYLTLANNSIPVVLHKKFVQFVHKINRSIPDQKVTPGRRIKNA